MLRDVLCVTMALLNFGFLIWCTWYILRVGKALSATERKSPRVRLLPIDANGPIVGGPTRAQWRLRRRALLEARAVCEGHADEYLRYPAMSGIIEQRGAIRCSMSIKKLISDYDAQSPEFSGVIPQETARVA